MGTRNSIVPLGFTILLLVLFAGSCKQDITNRYSYYFSSEGGPLLYELSIDGESIKLSSSGIEADKTIFIEDSINPDSSQWFTELEWIRVYYTPHTQSLFISVDKNTDGQDRIAVISCIGNGKDYWIEVKQAAAKL